VSFQKGGARNDDGKERENIGKRPGMFKGGGRGYSLEEKKGSRVLGERVPGGGRTNLLLVYKKG